MIKYDLQYFGGRGAHGTLKNPNGKIAKSKKESEAVNPIADSNFDVNSQKPTKASFLENMNEAQLAREILRLERRAAGAERQKEAAYNSGSVQRFNEIMEQYPGGVGGSAVNASYQKMVERAMNQMSKGVEAKERAESYLRQLEGYKKAYDTVKGSGLLVHEAETARQAVKGTLDGKWTKTDNAYIDTYGRPRPIAGQKNGDFTIGMSWASYRVFMNGKEIGSFKKASEAKALIEKYAKKKK